MVPIEFDLIYSKVLCVTSDIDRHWNFEACEEIRSVVDVWNINGRICAAHSVHLMG